ncbi:MAG: LamB/YcsF family protein, partial [Cyanobacteria bacterium HKST-UBA06]|nr:LamB/YcsF family protein [Cyanobacteria bacterium HKST-UBA06]
MNKPFKPSNRRGGGGGPNRGNRGGAAVIKGPKASPAPKDVTRHLDLNTNFGLTMERHYFEGRNIELLESVSSVNIPACVHDGHPIDVFKDIQRARSYDCSVGGLIGYPDPKNYGHHTMALSEEELTAWIQVQVGTFRALCQGNLIEVGHIRPYGALYLDFVSKPEVAMTVAKAIKAVDPWLILLCPIGAPIDQIESEIGQPTATELYLGKRISPEGKLDVDKFDDNMHPQSVFDQARQLIMEGTVTTSDGQAMSMACKSLHLHP